jgi:hypothetical protein
MKEILCRQNSTVISRQVSPALLLDVSAGNCRKRCGGLMKNTAKFHENAPVGSKVVNEEITDSQTDREHGDLIRTSFIFKGKYIKTRQTDIQTGVDGPVICSFLASERE